jgi:transcriptional regulator with XRE-family HTH domain
MMQLDREKLGEALRDMRERKGMTIRDLEAETGISKATISRAERAHPDVYASADTVIVLCFALGVSPFLFVKAFHGNTPMKQDCEARA